MRFLCMILTLFVMSVQFSYANISKPDNDFLNVDNIEICPVRLYIEPMQQIFVKRSYDDKSVIVTILNKTESPYYITEETVQKMMKHAHSKILKSEQNFKEVVYTEATIVSDGLLYVVIDFSPGY